MNVDCDISGRLASEPDEQRLITPAGIDCFFACFRMKRGRCGTIFPSELESISIGRDVAAQWSPMYRIRNWKPYPGIASAGSYRQRKPDRIVVSFVFCLSATTIGTKRTQEGDRIPKTLLPLGLHRYRTFVASPVALLYERIQQHNKEMVSYRKFIVERLGEFDW